MENSKSLIISGSICLAAALGFIGLNKIKNASNKKPSKKKAEGKEQSTEKALRKESSIQAELILHEENKIFPVDHLSKMYTDFQTEEYKNPLLKKKEKEKDKGFMTDENFTNEGCFCIEGKQFCSQEELLKSRRFLKGGARKILYWKAQDVKVCIVSCGGLCPGINVVIRELVMTLWQNYDVTDINGIKYGYKGFTEPNCWIKLDPEKVKYAHNLGGSILGSSRGYLDAVHSQEVADNIVDIIHKNGANMVYCIGGDGTHRGMLALVKSAKRKNHRIAFIGIPKTIDNDIAIIDKSFGFDSAVEVAQLAIKAADVEANSAEYGVGLVKVMGRHAGHIAMIASLSSRDVNLCLVPEFQFDLYDKKGVLEYICSRLKTKNHCVIVCGEGAGDACRDGKRLITERGYKIHTDPSGNVYPPDIGLLLKDEIPKYAKEKHGMSINLKYIDPTYMIRAVPAIPSDKHLCS